MAQAITNTVQPTQSFSGLLGLNKKPGSSGVANSTPALITPKKPAPKQEYTPLEFDNKGNIIPNSSKPITPPLDLSAFSRAGQNQGAVQQATQQPYATTSFNTQSTAPQMGGTGSGGTLNPNFNLQTGGGTATQTRGLFPDVLSSLAKFDPMANPAVSDAYQKAQGLNTALAESKKNEAKGTATLLRQAIPLGDQEGQARVLQDQYLKQQAALSSEFQGQSNIFSAGLTGTGQQLTGITSAAGLAPEALRYEGFGGGGDLSPQSRASDLAQQVKSGLISPQAAEGMMTALYGGAGATFLNQSLQGTGGFNYNTATAQSAAQQSNIQQQGTAAIDIARQGLSEATQSYTQMIGAAQFAGSQSQAVNGILNKTGLNNVSSTDYNKVLNNLQGRFSSEDFSALNTALREAQSAYAMLLSTGGMTPTGNENQALATLNINQSAGAIKRSIQELDNAVARRLQAQNQVRSIYEQNLSGMNSQVNNAANTGGAVDWNSL